MGKKKQIQIVKIKDDTDNDNKVKWCASVFVCVHVCVCVCIFVQSGGLCIPNRFFCAVAGMKLVFSQDIKFHIILLLLHGYILHVCTPHMSVYFTRPCVHTHTELTNVWIELYQIPFS